LQRQLREEKSKQVSHFSGQSFELTYVGKSRLLHRTATLPNAPTMRMIPKPKGGVGATGFSLISEMKLDKDNRKDKALYNDILVSTRVFSDARRQQFTNIPGICPFACNQSWYRSWLQV
jgi:hypothetical protein